MKASVANWERIMYCVRISPAFGSDVRIAQYPEDVTMSNGQSYSSDAGYEFTGYESGTNFAPSVLDLSSLAGLGSITLEDIAAGVYDNARVYVFATDWANPAEDEEELFAGLFGKVSLVDKSYKVEIMGLIDTLSQSVGGTFTARCQKAFGGQEFGGCHVDLAPITVTGSLTSVTSTRVVRDSTRTEAAEYFTAGTLQFTSGDNINIAPIRVKSYSADGAITLQDPLPVASSIGDTYTLIPGCLKTPDSCRAWSNHDRFGGYTHIPTNNQTLSNGSSS